MTDVAQLPYPTYPDDLADYVFRGEWSHDTWERSYRDALTHLRELKCRSGSVTDFYEPADPNVAAIVEEAQEEACRREAACYLAIVYVNAFRLGSRFSKDFTPAINPLTYLEDRLGDTFDEWVEQTRYVRGLRAERELKAERDRFKAERDDLRAELYELKACC
jgi:hypothetical protein